MNGLIVALLVVLFLSTACRDATPSARTPSQIAGAVRGAAWWRIVLWPLGLVVLGLLVALWYAVRFALWAAAYVLAAVSVRVATLAALDGRGLRLHRLEGGRL